ncbi:MAG: hypothetical protein ACD_28C00151G0009 [uncultured bacterium]|nr:MAG: hypothetical protein ACD_28C00151G0009 [uncultured bacterium]KKT74753.1 MAG: hypothetical protein UW70_C0046G0011 [Candidatus Peregrinibacteria bacterium GW2011_GWA2_44_7]
MSPILEKLAPPKNAIIKAVGNHWVTLVAPIIFFLFTWGICIMLFVLSRDIYETDYLMSLGIFVVTSWVLVIANHIFFIFMFKWIQSLLLITSKDVIDFDVIPLVRYDVGIIGFYGIQEMEEQIHGFLGKILNYGDIYMHVVWHPTVREFKYVPDPVGFISLVETLKKKMDIEKDSK